jgi:multiple sugar transport system permease protein
VVLKLFNTYALVLTYMVFTLPRHSHDDRLLQYAAAELDEAVMTTAALRRLRSQRVLVPILTRHCCHRSIRSLAWNEFLFAVTLTKTMDMRTVRWDSTAWGSAYSGTR